jgi:hypothetical protein
MLLPVEAPYAGYIRLSVDPPPAEFEKGGWGRSKYKGGGDE